MVKKKNLTVTNRALARVKAMRRGFLFGKRKRLGFDSLEERTTLSITIAALGDSLTDEYQFYAPYRTAAENWPEIISSLRPNQVDLEAFSATGAGRGQTRNQGYAQDWALQGMTAQGNDLLGYTPVQTAAAAVGSPYGTLLLGFLRSEVANVNYNGSPQGGSQTYESMQKFAADNNLGYVDINGLLKAFIANLTVSGVYINPKAAGPVYTDMFVGDSIHPGTIAQAILASGIISQIDTWYPNAITPLTNAQILQLAQNVQPKTTAILTSSARSINLGQQVVFKLGIPTFPANYEASPTPPAKPGNIEYPAATGVVTFFDGSNRNQVLGVASLDSTGAAVFAASKLSPGLHQITAVYSGDTVYPPAVSQTVSILVGGSAAQVKVLNFV